MKEKRVATLIERAIGAAKLDSAAYEDVEADPGAMGQALTVVVIASIASGLGQGAASGGQGIGLVGGIVAALIGWFIWAVTTYIVGTKMLPEPETKADLGQILRTTGFAAAPGVAGILGFVPGVGTFILFAVSLWQLAAMVVAVRQALDYTSTGRAVAVCVVGFLIQLAVVFALVLVFAGAIAAIVGTGPAPTAIP
jgi:hypothetical protein